MISKSQRTIPINPLIRKISTHIIVGITYLGIPSLRAQNCPSNIDFENGNLNSWYFFTGTCCPISAGNATSSVSGRHTLVSGTSTDAYGNFPEVCPNGGKYSMKIGNNNTGSEAEKARYYLRVPKDVNNYSISLSYAVVFQDPGHATYQQPRFEVKVSDSVTGKSVGCGTFTFIASSNLPGFKKSSSGSQVYYKPWSTISINLSGYAGKTIIMDFASGDCSQGGHFGYGYFDLNCSRFQVGGAVCPGGSSLTLSAPEGFSSYKWYDSALKTNVGSGQNITLNSPKANTKYKVIITPYSGFGCTDTLQTTVEYSQLKIDSLTKDTTVCHGNKITLKSKPNDLNRFLPITSEWKTKKGASLCSICDQYEFTPASSDTFYYFAKNNAGCRDSARVVINVTPQLSFANDISDQRICENQPALFVVKPGLIKGTTIQWYKDGKEVLAKFNKDSLYIPKATFAQSGYYQARISNRCDTIYSTKAYLRIDTAVHLMLQNNGSELCENEALKLTQIVSGTRPYTYSWKKDGNTIASAQSDTLIKYKTTYLDSGFYMANVQGACGADSAKVRIVVHPSIKAAFSINNTTQCFNEQAYHFSNQSTIRWGNFSSKWDLGNGANSLTKNVSYDSFAPGTYTAKLLVKSDFGCRDSATGNIIINPSPKAVITANEISSCYNEQHFTFTDNSSIAYSNMIRSWEIDNINADTNKLITPSTALNTGDHLVYLKTVSEYGCVDSTYKSVTVFANPVSKILTANAITCFNELLTFTDASTISEGRFVTNWKTLGTNKNNSAVFQPVFSAPGTYIIQNKNISDMGCTDSSSLPITIHPNPTAGLSINQPAQCEKEQLFDVQDKSTINQRVLKRVWSVDAKIISDTAKNLSLNGFSTGEHSIKLLSYSNNLCKDSITQTVTVHPSPIAMGIVPKNAFCENAQSFIFIDSSKLAYGSLSVQWKFGDLSTKSGQKINKKYSTTGNFTNWQILTSDKNCSDSISHLTTVHPAPVARFTINDPGQCDGTQLFAITDQSTIAYTEKSPTWELDGVTLPQHQPQFNIKNLGVGLHQLKLTTISAFGCSDNANKAIRVYADPTAAFQVSARQYCIDNQNFRFEDKSQIQQGNYQIVWQFGDKSGSTNRAEKHLFKQPGKYDVKLITRSDSGCMDSISLEITVRPNPVAKFTITDSLVELPVFNNHSEEANQYFWDFGNGSTRVTTDKASFSDIPFDFKKQHKYPVTLKVTDTFGCWDTAMYFVQYREPYIFIPNAIVTGPEGLNKLFEVSCFRCSKYEMKIFNRWGAQIFESSKDVAFPAWDGSYNGQPVMDGVYVYLITIRDLSGALHVKSGTLTVLR